MNKAIIGVVLLYTLSISISMAQHHLTTFELSKGTQTATYQQTINYYTALSASSPFIQMVEQGITDSGYPLHLVILDPDQGFDFNRSRRKNKTIVLINNGIHPGEPDGIEASKMLLRDYALDPQKRKLINDLVIVIIPVYNIGGALNRNSFSRANQNGPEAYGFRGNARNYDLNRDFIKSDTRNAKAFYQLFHTINPDVFIDTHVSNGADYQYTITHLATQHNKLGGELGTYLETEFTPALEASMLKKDSEITPYVNVFNTTPDPEGFSQFMDGARYSTGYTTLFHTLGFMIETHMLKPFDIRVRSTYNFLVSILELASQDGAKIQALRKSNQALIAPGNSHPIRWRLDRETSKDITFKGYEGKQVMSEVTGQTRLLYDRSQPFTKTIPYYNTFVPDVSITIPDAYIIPQSWHAVIDRLLLNGVEHKRFKNDTTLTVERYTIADFKTASSPYEGHYSHSNTAVDKQTLSMTFRAGDYWFPTQQFGGRYLVEVLEPEASDSFFNWNFFDTVLQQKEHFSPYVFEDLAQQLLESDADLKREFEEKKSQDEEFASNWYAQLDFIYKRSDYYEKDHLQYPVYRLK